MTEIEIKRLAWRCRRGMLELDIVLQKFMQNRFESLSAAELNALDALLDYPDHEFWDLVSRRQQVTDNADLSHLLDQIRNINWQQAN